MWVLPVVCDWNLCYVCRKILHCITPLVVSVDSFLIQKDSIERHLARVPLRGNCQSGRKEV